MERLFAAAAETGMQLYLTTEIRPVRAASPVAGDILPGGGAILGERLEDVLNPDNWTETRLVTTEGGEHRADRPAATVLRFPSREK